MTSRNRNRVTVMPVALLVIAACVGTAAADWVTTTVSAGTSPQFASVNPVTNKVYVANRTSNNVTVIDGATNDLQPHGGGPVRRRGEPGDQQGLRGELQQRLRDGHRRRDQRHQPWRPGTLPMPWP